MGEVETPLRAGTPKRKRDHISHDRSPRLTATPPISCRGIPTATAAAHPMLAPATIAGAHTSFSFEVPAYEGDDGSSSPRTKVARRFQGLALDSGVGALAAGTAGATAATAAEAQSATVPRTHHAGSPSPGRVATAAMMHDSGTDDDDDDVDDDEYENGDGYFSARKRFKAPQRDGEGDSPSKDTTSMFAPVAETSSMDAWAARLQAAGALGDPAKSHSGSAAAGSSGGAYNKTHHRNYKTVGLSPRAETPPPLVGAKTTAKGEPHAEEGPPSSSSSPSSLSPSSHREIVDPVRAALTWHEDEITVYDPDDEDDDGTGINGIGFKPTPAIAHARTLKRRQQLAEYRKREEREARARRSLRRRGSPAVSGSGAGSTEGGGGGGGGGAVAVGGVGGGGGGGGGVIKSAEQQQRQAARRQQLAARRVRFLDVEPTVVITT